jgi:hypothetical protein
VTELRVVSFAFLVIERIVRLHDLEQIIVVGIVEVLGWVWGSGGCRGGLVATAWAAVTVTRAFIAAAATAATTPPATAPRISLLLNLVARRRGLLKLGDLAPLQLGIQLGLRRLGRSE